MEKNNIALVFLCVFFLILKLISITVENDLSLKTLKCLWIHCSIKHTMTPNIM